MDKLKIFPLNSPKSDPNHPVPEPVLPGNELAALDFEALIGGPLVACVHGQVQAAMATVNFIKTVGFEKTNSLMPDNNITTGKVNYITFNYSKTLHDGSVTEAHLQVPLLTMMPIPHLRLDEVHIDFMAKIESTQATNIDKTIGLGGEAFANLNTFVVTAGIKAAAVYQRQTKEGNVVTRDYSLNIRIKATQDDMPTGVEKVMSILEGSIRECDEYGNPIVQGAHGGKIGPKPKKGNPTDTDKNEKSAKQENNEKPEEKTNKQKGSEPQDDF